MELKRNECRSAKTRRGLAGQPRSDTRAGTSRETPALVLSVDPFNHGPAELVVILPITSKAKGVPLHVAVLPPEGGLSLPSFIKCEDVRSVSKGRLLIRLGVVSIQTLVAVEDRIKRLLGL